MYSDHQSLEDGRLNFSNKVKGRRELGELIHELRLDLSIGVTAKRKQFIWRGSSRGDDEMNPIHAALPVALIKHWASRAARYVRPVRVR